MTRIEQENKVLEEIFDSNVKLKDLRLGELIYLKDLRDKKVRDEKKYHNVSCMADFSLIKNSSIIRKMLKEGCDWRSLVDETIITGMYPEEALYIDCLARLNEIYDEICVSLSRSLDNMIIK